MRPFYDPRIATNYPAYFCRGVQQAANLLYRLSSEQHNNYFKNRYKLKTSDYLVQGTPTKVGQSLDDDYDFNAHTVNEMFEFLAILYHLKVIRWFGEYAIQLDRSKISQLKEIGQGKYTQEIHVFIQMFDLTSHAKTNGFRLDALPTITEDS